MATATELTINTAATALDMAQEMFGDGIEIVNASYSGAAASSGIYSGATSSIPGIASSASGVILSTGNVGTFTNGDGSSNTNTGGGAGTDVAGGVDGDAGLNSIAGVSTFDGAIFQADFIPTGDYLTMQFVFSSEEYLEYVNGGVNDAVGVWVNGSFVPLTVGSGVVSIDTLNNSANSNLYVNNPDTADLYNTEMDGFTVTLSLKAPVVPGSVNTIRIGIADGGDAVYDSNLLISGDSIQTVTLAMDDEINVLANGSRTFDILANDTDLTETGLTITQINGQDIAVGGTVALSTGGQVTLNADGTITVLADGDTGSNSFTYTVEDGSGNTDVGFITVNTAAAPALDGIVQGGSGADSIGAGYPGDPDGDRIDNGDAILVGETGHDDIVHAGAGNDTVEAGLGSDEVYGGADNDLLFGDTGSDALYGGTGADTLFGNDDADTLAGGAGGDSLDGGIGADAITGGNDRDTIIGGSGDVVDGGEGGDDQDRLNVTGVQSIIYDDLNGENGTITFIDASTMTFTNIENVILNGGNPDGLVIGSGGDDSIGMGYVDANGDVIDNGDSILSYPGSDDDEIYAGGGNDTISALNGNDSAFGGDGNDLIDTGVGDDNAQGDAGNDTVYGNGGNDYIRGDAGDDAMFGGAGDDSVYGGLDNDYVYAGIGNDSGFGGYGNDFVYGGDGSDTITGSSGDDAVYGDAGDDVIQGSDGADKLFGGTGNDTMLGEEDGDTFYAGVGDYVDGYESVTTGTDNDTLYVDDVASISWDPFNGESGTVTFNGGGTLAFYNIENLYVDGVLTSPPDYIVEGSGGADLIDADYVGDPEGDLIDAGDNAIGTDADVVQAGDGNDTVLAGAGNDSVDGGAGADSLVGGGGNDTLLGQAGADTLQGQGGDDSFVLTNGFGNDSILGGETAEGSGDTLNLSGLAQGVTVDLTAADPESGSVSNAGGSATFSEIENIVLGGGADTVMLADGSGDDQVEGFSAPIDNGDGSYTGIDRLDVADLTDSNGDPVNTDDVSVSDDGIGNAVLTFPNGEAITLVGVAPADVTSPAQLAAIGIPRASADGIVSGTAGNDLIDYDYVGDPEGDLIDHGDAVLPGQAAQDDIVRAGAGDDTVYSGLGNDEVDTGSGNDVADGGDGADTLWGADGDDTLIGGNGDDRVDGGVGFDLLQGGVGNDNLVGDAGNDTLKGDVGADQLFGEEGDDRLFGGDNNDSLFGGLGADTLDGGLGDDIVQGGAGSDVFLDGAGADQLSGGDDRDVFHTGAEDVVDGGEGGDDHDTLDLSAYGKSQTNVIYDPMNSENGTVQFLDAGGNVIGAMTFENIEHVIPCFTPGIRIQTDQGEVKVEDLKVGDHVLTRDHGYQPIRWAGQRRLSRIDLAAQPKLNPVRIRAGALGDGLPQADILVSPQHRMLMAGPRTEMFFGEHEVLVAATHLVGEAGVQRVYPNGVTYIHLLFDQHQIIRAEGAWTESFQPGDLTLQGMDAAQRDELLVLFPELSEETSLYPAARLTLKGHEVRVLLSI